MLKGMSVFILLCLAVIFVAWDVSACIGFTATNSYLERAKDAGNPQQVAEFLTEYKEALRKNNMIEGKYQSVFKYPGGYMPTYIRAVDGLIERANSLAKQSSVDTSYQMGLVNLEKDLGDIETAADRVWIASGGWIIIVLSILFAGSFIIVGGSILGS